MGTDGCSVPTFAIPLYNTALGTARLADPRGLPERRADALRHIFKAMSSYPQNGRFPWAFDTMLMEAAGGKIVSKGGAEGYQGIAVAPGVIGPDAPGFGIAFKIADGDVTGRARPIVALELLRQLGVLTVDKAEQMAHFDRHTLHNFRRLEVGDIRSFSI